MKNTKICSICHRELPLECFGKSNCTKDGLRYECKECRKQYYAEHKEEISTKNRERYQKQRENILKNATQYREKHRNELKIKSKEYRETEYGRAYTLLRAYNKADERHHRGKGDLTVKWIVENIFTKPCAHCGKTGWKVIGCNRLDNSKPHTVDNVEPCCWECNRRLGIVYTSQKNSIGVDQIDPQTGEVIASYPSSRDAARTIKTSNTNIIRACNGGFLWKDKWYNVTQCKGYRWTYKPL